jgi:YD repeat-containing protein
MTTTKQYDFLNRLLSISSVPSASSAVSFAYDYNSANQRTRCRLADGSLWVYTYDPLGQLIGAKHFWPDWTPVAGQQFEYTFDDIGNRTATKAGGDENGANLRSASYSANALNQYTSRTNAGAVDIMGLALAPETVTVNGDAPYRKGEYSPGLPEAIVHEQCHCEDWAAAYAVIIGELDGKEYQKKSDCERALQSFDFKKRMDQEIDPSLNHNGKYKSKYSSGGSCYAVFKFRNWP